MEEIKESWEHKIRSLAPKLQEAEYKVFKAEADVKKISAQLKLKAMSTGAKTVAAQEVFAENNDLLYNARLTVGVSKGNLTSWRVQLEALKVGFEEWRTKMVNAREERKRYGA
jgi:hypothetical protein